jgi:2-oxoglutarate/2-oxoacid ferredoxin oxidoreductase subunit beta
MHDGSHLLLKKLGKDYDPSDKMRAVQTLHEAAAGNQVVTGLIYLDTSRPTLVDMLNLVEEPLATLPEARVRPSRAALDEIVQELR